MNVKETANGYQLEVIAPDLNKEDFKISLDNNILTVSAEKATDTREIMKSICSGNTTINLSHALYN